MKSLTLKKLLPIFIILLVEFILISVSYRLGTFLLGWDNLFPEINFFENIRRSYFAIWQEYRGLGLLDGMSFAANLPHYLFLSFLNLFLAQSLLRYLFVFLMHFLGGLGIFLLVQELIRKNQNKLFISLFGSLFYLFNIATIQIFFAPYEAFLVHFAFLPFLVLFAMRFLENGAKINLFWLALLSLLAAPQAHIPTLFLVYSIALFAFLGFHLLSSGKRAIKRIVVILILTFTVNSFWGLPYFYSSFKNAKMITNSKINQMSTEDVYLKNKDFGDLKSVVLLKGFFLDFIDPQREEERLFMMEDWRNHSQSLFFILIGSFYFLLVVGGIIKIIFKRKYRLYPFVFLFVFSFLMLGNNIPFLRIIHSYLNNQVPYFSQIFRFVFTKFSILFVFSFTVLLSFCLSIIIGSSKKLKFVGSAFLFILFVTLGYHTLPSFQGQFLYKNLKVEPPAEYFDLTKYFSEQNKNGRIALLPQPSYWGWTYTRWGYRGSGFIWYGLPQASLDGAFYPWSKENENYYWEISYALYSGNLGLFEKVLEKYQINWLLMDGNVINPSSPKALYIDELEEMTSISNKISLVQEQGKIKIYKVRLEVPIKDFVFLAENLSQVNPVYNWNNFDLAYLENGNYINSRQIYFPFRTLFTGRSQEDLEFEISENEDYFFLTNEIPEEIKDYHLIIPEEEIKELTYVDPENLSNFELLQPEVKFDETTIEVKIPKVSGLYSSQIEPTEIKDLSKAINCQEYLQGKVENEIIQENNSQFLRLKAIDAKNCGTTFWLPNLTHQMSYLITIEARHVKGKSLLFWLENHNSRKADLETYLPKTKSWQKYIFIQPPMEEDGLGYSLHFDNLSIGQVESVNDLGKITVNPFPFKFLTSLKLINPKTSTSSAQLNEPSKVYHPNPSQYTVKGDFKPNQILILSQAYHNGWLAWEGKPFLGKRLEHVLVNNWQNGWILPNNLAIEQSNNLTIYILFWPQLLEYFGFLILLTTSGLIIGYCFLFKK